MANFITGALTTSARDGTRQYLASGKGSLQLYGTFSAGSPVVSLQTLAADGSWVSASTTYNSEDADAIDIKRPGYVRVQLSGGDGSTDIDYEIHAG